ncbi:MAG: NUDIX hydrolase [Bacteroidota bacterium]|nr:NUDIX hydrolase [Bacteroidota bacterium]
MTYTYKYPRPAVTTDAILFDNNLSEIKVLLIQRKNAPYQDCWAFAGGFVDMDETVEACAVRELREETGVSNVELKQFKTYSAVNRDPRGRTISVVFYGFCDLKKVSVSAADDAKDVKWFQISDLPELAFDHLEILQELLCFLKE